jgi:predicted lipase
VIVSFRGTNPISIKNWIDDFTFKKESADFKGLNVNIHSGFLNSYQTHADAVFNKVSNLLLENPDFKLIITGHSLGGAMATLCAMDLHLNKGIENIFLITFGSPRVGDSAFADAFDRVFADKSWRVTNQHDVVPHVPLIRMGFKHVATEVWFNDSTNFHVGDESGEDASLSDGNRINLSILDHIKYLQIQYIPCLF